MPVVIPPRRLRCTRCGAYFTCGAGASEDAGRCWCATLPPLRVRLPEADCVCPDCLRAEILRQQAVRDAAGA